MFVNNCGISGLIREGMAPVGSNKWTSTLQMLSTGTAHALFIDWTHDKPSPVVKKTVKICLPVLLALTVDMMSLFPTVQASLLSAHTSILQETISSIQSYQTGLSSHVPDLHTMAHMLVDPVRLCMLPSTVLRQDSKLVLSKPEFRLTSVDGVLRSSETDSSMCTCWSICNCDKTADLPPSVLEMPAF